jgi:hypothetical protein
MNALGRKMSISISPLIYLHVLKEGVIAVGDGFIRRMEEVLRCINWDIGVKLPELPLVDHYLNVSRPVPSETRTDVQLLFRGNATSRTMSATVQSEQNSLITGFKQSQ